VARAWAAPAVVAVAQGAVADALGAAGGAPGVLPRLARAEALVAVVPVSAAALPRDGGEVVLDGQTGPVVGAADASLLAVLALDADAWWLMPASTPGVQREPAAPDLGLCAAPPAVVSLRGVRPPAASPSSTARRLMGVVHVGLAAVTVGVGQAAFEAALRYSQQRSTFGKAICQHQAVQLKLADMATWLTAARLLVSDAAMRIARGEHDAAARARRFAAEAVLDITLESMRIHGGYGYTTEFPVERYYRDAATLMAGVAHGAA
jgi:hypothetical protein